MLKNNFIKIIIIFIILSIFIYAFSSSYVSHNITNLAYVVAIGLDVIDDNSINNNSSSSDISNSTSYTNPNKIKVSFQFINTSALGEQG